MNEQNRYELVTGETATLGQMQSEWEIQETELEMLMVASRLTAQELKTAQLILEGHPPLESAAIAGLQFKTLQDGVTYVSNLLKRPLVTQYMEVAKRLYTQRAMQAVCFDKVNWMKDLKEVLDKSLGKTKTNVVAQFEGHSTSQQVKRDDLATAKATLEMIGKHMGWMVDKKEVTLSTKNVVRVRDYTSSATPKDITQDTADDQDLLHQLNNGLAEVVNHDDDAVLPEGRDAKKVVSIGLIHDTRPKPAEKPAPAPKEKPNKVAKVRDAHWPDLEEDDVDTEW